AGESRQDGSWSQTLGQVSARLFERAAGSRLRVRVMHPMDTGLAGGIPAFYMKRLSVQDAGGHELARVLPFEPVSENPVFSFDFAHTPAGGVRLVGIDNDGNRIAGQVQ
ncbi:MAG: thiosulfate oxidation carrier complex protein SoxZ, partial [Burkholderiales bacterium]|nr:thiosulfate oxidation carrier complex protein SoxZ [Burkholderiales bacterium]